VKWKKGVEEDSATRDHRATVIPGVAAKAEGAAGDAQGSVMAGEGLNFYMHFT